MGQKYITINGSTVMVRVTGCPQKNFHISKLDEAIEYRNALCQSIGVPFSKPSTHNSPRYHSKPHARKSSDLPVGLTYSVTRKKLANGTESIYTAIRAGVTINGKTYYKHFSVDTYGHSAAVNKAITFRKSMLKIKHRTS